MSISEFYCSSTWRNCKRK